MIKAHANDGKAAAAKPFAIVYFLFIIIRGNCAYFLLA
jgi:hypothetical protein